MTGRIFVSESGGDGDNPLIQVFTVGAGSTVSPLPPTVSLVSPTDGATFAPFTSITRDGHRQ